ncbi:uncharacterized protein OCT59_004200 [Rhizophagus irregularis]|uniref:uncharacterized protein n=1 Tax=Rhizophagus irregularis TaxID=588596 RepID=UPI0019F0CF04|nr:hypothetical protein OCT59_004200 [Rhizophagus irregularis]GBC53713.2 hypothetical protein GLOIN_2v1770600 [Rhizophagus irregularis DAOM 181602=DAOM 197198]CAG8510202.1 14585_t:CDS:2 [Rhizophagus irregularis]
MGIGSPYDIRNQVMDDLIKAYSSTFASGIKRFTMRPISHTLGYDSHLVMNRLSEFYLCIPRPLELQTENQGPFIVNEEQRRTRLISLDPGVRTFMTCYSPDGYTAS